MPYAEDLLDQARQLATKERTRPRQASLRRAVSTAYYALFHLLIASASAHWTPARQRFGFGRMFEHGRMYSACLRKRPGSPDDLAVVTEAFRELHDHRQTADYDGSREWSRPEVIDIVDEARAAFDSWKRVRKHPAAHDLLLSFLSPRNRL